jgi:hypothetical protein
MSLSDTIKSFSWSGTDLRFNQMNNNPLGFRENNKDTIRNDRCNIYGLSSSQVAYSIVKDLLPGFDKLIVSSNSSDKEFVNGVTSFRVRERIPLNISALGVVASIEMEKNCSSLIDCDTISLIDLDYVNIVFKKRSFSGYSVDAVVNCAIISEEIDLIYTNIHSLCPGDIKIQSLLRDAEDIKSIYRVWTWFNRVETQEKSLSLTCCGAISILENLADNSSKESRLGTNIYNSNSRSQCKILCGWSWNSTFDFSLFDFIIEEFEESFERASAIALWYHRI